LCVAQRDEESEETEDEHSQGVAPGFAEVEKVLGRWGAGILYPADGRT